ncbi:hypothetical protein BFW01_g11460 [Lasiodiplodia theobromae]|nr:hypothetical protein BFW01_g11460 [Lasiodiplodia theobromae]
MPPPSIILTPATSSTSEQARNVSLHIAPARRPSTENITNQYRNRYALYLAAQFNISAAAAFVEIDEQIRFNHVFIVGMVAADLHFGSAEAKRSMKYAQQANWDRGL